MLRVFLVVAVLGLGSEVGSELLHHAGDEVVDGLLLGGIAVPDRDEVAVESNRETYTAELIIGYRC